MPVLGRAQRKERYKRRHDCRRGGQIARATEWATAMRFFFLSAVKDLRRYRRDSTSLLLWFVLPLVIAALIGTVFGRDNANLQGLLLIADEDHGYAGTFLRESISRGPLGTILAMQQVARADGRQRIDKGDGSALLIIPKGYDRAVMMDEPAQWTLITNPELSIMPRIVREVASANVDAANYLQQVAGSQLRVFHDTPVSQRSLLDLATGVGRSASGVNIYLNPPRIKVKTTEVGDPSAHRQSISEMLFPGIVLLVILMMSAGMSMEIWKDAAAGAPRRVAAASSSLSGFLAGKVLATSIVLMAAILFTFAAGRATFGVPLRALPLALAWAGASAVATYCGLLLMQLLLASEHTATTVGGLFLVPLAMIGGCFFPLESMPANFARVAGFTPNGWMLVRLKAMLAGPVPHASLAHDFAVLLGAAGILFLLVRRAMEHRLVA
jgi:ABC-2 type transport system permease protein